MRSRKTTSRTSSSAPASRRSTPPSSHVELRLRQLSAGARETTHKRCASRPKSSPRRFARTSSPPSEPYRRPPTCQHQTRAGQHHRQAQSIIAAAEDGQVAMQVQDIGYVLVLADLRRRSRLRTWPGQADPRRETAGTRQHSASRRNPNVAGVSRTQAVTIPFIAVAHGADNEGEVYVNGVESGRN